MIKFLAPFVLLTISNVFMTFAWYGHLKHKSAALWAVILISWGIAFFEYCFQVPANRIGSSVYSAAQLKTIQEIITLVVFSFFSGFIFKEEFKWNYLVGFYFYNFCSIFYLQKVVDNEIIKMERKTGLEPATSTLGRLHSTTELLPHHSKIINLK